MMLPLLWLSLAFIAGVVIASLITLPLPAWLALAGFALVLAIAWRVVAARKGLKPFNLQAGTQTLISICVLGLLLGAARYQSNVPKLDPFYIAWYNDREYDVLVTGTINELPDERDAYTNLRVNVESVDTGDGDLPVHGLILARVAPNVTYHYGERVRLRGKLQTPPENEDFSYRDYLAREGVHAYMPKGEITRLPGEGGNPIFAAIYGFKGKAFTNLHMIFPQPEADLLAGILLGMESGIPADLQKAFKDTGTTHIIAISGFNIAIIANLFLWLFSRALGERKGAFAAIAGITLYTVLVGADAAVVRAALMGSAGIFAHLIGRRQNGLNTLAFVGALMAVLNPLVMWDVGYQLSFAATLGLILYADRFEHAATSFIARYIPSSTAEKIAGPLAEYVLFTLAAQLTTLPVMAYHFQRISLIALIANPFILPAQPPLMLSSGLALLMSLAYVPLGKIAALLAWPFTAYTIRMVEEFSTWPGGVLVLGEFNVLFAILFYLALFAWTLAGSRIKDFLLQRGLQVNALTATSVLAIMTILTWRLALAVPDGKLHLTFLDVGSADAVLIQTPSGRTVLVNGGPSLSVLSDALGRRLSPLARRLDWLVVASTQENQVAALPRTLDRFPPANVLWAGKIESSFSASALDAWMAEESIPVTQAVAGQELSLGDGSVLRVLTLGSRGAILLVEWNRFRAMLPIGVNFENLEELQNGKRIGQVSALLLAESGYAPVNPPEWIRDLNPQVIVLSVAAGDKLGLPDQEVLDAVKDYSLLRTDRNGWIHISTNGKEMWVEVEKK
jgi:competence protein ComEC